MSKDITVAFSTFSEEHFEWVLELLKSLEKQTVKDFEVSIVVNSNKRYFYKLLDTLKNETQTGYEISIVFNSVDKGIAHSRNIALKHARTTYIAYTDDDVIPHPRWLEELLRAIKLSQKATAVTGPVFPRWEKGTENYSLWFPKELYWIMGCTPWSIEKLTVVRNGFTSNLMVDRKTLFKIGGFNENFGYNPRSRMTGEDPELGINLARAGYITVWNPNAIVFHRVSKERFRTRNIITRSFLEGQMKAHLSKLYGKNVLKLEAKHLKLTLKSFVKKRFLKSKALLLLTTIAVLSSYLTYRILCQVKLTEARVRRDELGSRFQETEVTQ
jgi:GT2 family glycosyltransferase